MLETGNSWIVRSNMADVAVAKRGLGVAIWIGIDMGNMGGSLNGSPKPSVSIDVSRLNFRK